MWTLSECLDVETVQENTFLLAATFEFQVSL